jgi:uncharacterized protein (DUF362 family)
MSRTAPPAVVHTVRCKTYEAEEVRGALAPLLESLLGPRLSGETRVLVKPNLLRGGAPERAVATHPAVLLETVRWLKERGCEVTVADSPGLGSTRGNLKTLGALEALERLGARVRDLDGPVRTAVPGGAVVPLSRRALEAEILLNLPKWKTHVQAGLTAGIKNLFGCVVGARKALLHIRGGHREDEFAAMLCGIAAVLRPALTVVDGVVAMEGDGPLHGTPKAVGYLVAGEDPVALDAVLARAMGFAKLPLLAQASFLGTGESDPEKVSLRGAGLPDADTLQFVLPARSSFTFHPVRRLLVAARGGVGRFETVRENAGPSPAGRTE